jgi:hypothetical protein
MTWQPRDWNTPSTLQLRVTPAKKGATISIHHEKMQNGDQREKMRAHWSTVMEKFQALIER